MPFLERLVKLTFTFIMRVFLSRAIKCFIVGVCCRQQLLTRRLGTCPSYLESHNVPAFREFQRSRELHVNIAGVDLAKF